MCVYIVVSLTPLQDRNQLQWLKKMTKSRRASAHVSLVFNYFNTVQRSIVFSGKQRFFVCLKIHKSSLNLSNQVSITGILI